jgi:hypothetical protein
MSHVDRCGTEVRSSCSYLAGLLGDQLVGTANETAAWILLEHAGPWGKNALQDSDLDRDLLAEIERRMSVTGARVQLISPSPGERPQWMYLAADPLPPATAGPGLARLRCSTPSDVLRIDFGALVAGAMPTGAQVVTRPLYLICANEVSDPCCGRTGPPTFAAVAGLVRARGRRTTHLGGHKYAANMMVFPPGLCYGRLGPASVPDVVHSAEDGRVHLGQYRGRPAYRLADQAAEHFLRVSLGLTGVSDVTLVAPAADGRGAARFAVAGGGRYDVTVSAEKRDPPRLQSCSDDRPTVPVVWSCAGVEPA